MLLLLAITRYTNNCITVHRLHSDYEALPLRVNKHIVQFHSTVFIIIDISTLDTTGPNYCTMLMLAIKHRHDDHSRLSSSGNLFFDVWHNLPFKKEGLLCCFLEWKRL